jgi:uncharacterized repeat protein (TIGR01451 family)
MKATHAIFVALLLLGALAAGGTLLAAPAAPVPLTPAPAPPLDAPVGNAAAFVMGDQLYLAGGWVGVSANAQAGLRRSALVAGAPQAWATVPAPLNPPRYGQAVAVAAGRAYLLGGSTGSATDRVQSYDGKGWREERKLPKAVNFPTAATRQGRIYVAGGVPGPVADVWSAAVATDGALGEWLPEAPLPLAMITQLVTARNCLFVVGGRDIQAKAHAEVHRAVVSGDGRITGWDPAPADLPEGRAWHAAVARGDTIYVLGGTADGASYTQQYYSAAVDAQCHLSGWTTGTLPDRRGRVAAAASDGVYWLGGQLETLQGPWASGGWHDAPTPTPKPTFTPTPTSVPDSIALTLSVEQVARNHTYEYRIRFANQGSDAAAAVVIQNAVPEGVEFAGSADGVHDAKTGIVTWQLDTVQPGEAKAVAYQVNAKGAGVAPAEDPAPDPGATPRPTAAVIVNAGARAAWQAGERAYDKETGAVKVILNPLQVYLPLFVTGR